MKHLEMYLNFLKKEGFFPEANENNIIFKYEGKTYLFNIDPNDKQFFQLIFPNFWSIENTSVMSKALYIANDVNAGLKVGQIIIVKDNVWAVAEMFIDETPNLEDFFMRTLGVVKEAVDRFSKGMLGKEPDILSRLLGN